MYQKEEITQLQKRVDNLEQENLFLKSEIEIMKTDLKESLRNSAGSLAAGEFVMAEDRHRKKYSKMQD